jgi:hypothetical protein
MPRLDARLAWRERVASRRASITLVTPGSDGRLSTPPSGIATATPRLSGQSERTASLALPSRWRSFLRSLPGIAGLAFWALNASSAARPARCTLPTPFTKPPRSAGQATAKRVTISAPEWGGRAAGPGRGRDQLCGASHVDRHRSDRWQQRKPLVGPVRQLIPLGERGQHQIRSLHYASLRAG